MIYGIQIGQNFGPSAANEPDYVTVTNNRIGCYVTGKVKWASPTYTANYYEATDGAFRGTTISMQAGDGTTGAIKIGDAIISKTSGSYFNAGTSGFTNADAFIAGTSSTDT
jgi:hypothetical protein